MDKLLLDRLTELGKLTPSEKKLARYFEQERSGLAFDNLAGVSEKVGVGKSTVTRFVVRLGYADFHAFLREIKKEAASSLDTPLERYASRTKNKRDTKPLETHLNAVQENLQHTMLHMNMKEYALAVKLLSDTKRPLYLMGSATAAPLMTYFFLLLSYLRNNVTLLDGDAPTIAHRVEHLDKKTVLFALAFNRYPKLTGTVMSYFEQKGAEIIFLTDRHTSPLLSTANIKLVVDAEGPNMFKTRCSAMAVLEGLLSEIASKVEKQIPARYAEKTDLMHHLDVYTNE